MFQAVFQVFAGIEFDFHLIIVYTNIKIKWPLPSGQVVEPSNYRQPIQRAGRAARRHFQHMRINHRGADIGVTQKLLHGADVGASLQQMRSKTKFQ